jgi:hypothetical protein
MTFLTFPDGPRSIQTQSPDYALPDPLEDNPYDLDQYDIWIDDSDEEHGA